LSLQRDQNSHSITGLIIAGFILILLLTMMNFALVSLGEQLEFDPDDLGFMELGTLNSILARFFFAALVLGFELGVFATTLRLEYLRGHIGEKRPADQMTKLIKFFLQACFVTTALFDSAVVLILFIQRKVFNFRRCFVMRKIVPLSLFEENFLVQGGL
jgi:hypothetical protein